MEAVKGSAPRKGPGLWRRSPHQLVALLLLVQMLGLMVLPHARGHGSQPIHNHAHAMKEMTTDLYCGGRTVSLYSKWHCPGTATVVARGARVFERAADK